MRRLGTVAIALLFASFSQAQAQTSRPQTAAQPDASQAPQGSAPAAGASHTGIDPAKEADIRRLQEVAGIKSKMTEIMAGIQKNMKPTLMNILPPGDYRETLIDLFVEKFSARGNVEFPKLLDAAIPVYDKYFSDEDIKGLILFYQSPLGKKTLSVLPQITIEMYTQGQQLGEKIGRETMEQVLSEHPELAKALQDARAGGH